MVRSFVIRSLGHLCRRRSAFIRAAVILMEVAIGVLPLVGLISATLGSILAGWRRRPRPRGIGALGAVILAIAYRKAHPCGA